MRKTLSDQIEQHIREVDAAAPPLTAERRAKLAALLLGSDPDQIRRAAEALVPGAPEIPDSVIAMLRAAGRRDDAE